MHHGQACDEPVRMLPVAEGCSRCGGADGPWRPWPHGLHVPAEHRRHHPAEIVLPLAGYLASTGWIGFTSAVIAATVGELAGFLGQYAIGRAGGRTLLLRHGRYVMIAPRHLAQADSWFKRYGDRAVLIARLLPVVRGLVSLPAWVAGMPVLPFAAWSAIGPLP